MKIEKCKIIYYINDKEEEYSFSFNPKEYKLPIADIRATTSSFYNIKHIAFSEEAQIEVSNEYAPFEMIEKLEEIFLKNTKPLIFIDHLQRSFLVSLSEFEKKSPRKIRGINYYGFLIVFDIVVLN